MTNFNSTFHITLSSTINSYHSKERKGGGGGGGGGGVAASFSTLRIVQCWSTSADYLSAHPRVICYLSRVLCLILCIEFWRSCIGMKVGLSMLCCLRHQRELQPTVRH